MDNTSLKSRAVNGVLWNALNGAITKILNFVFGILVARVLLPEDYGTVAMVTIFIALSQTFVDSGFGNALIRKQDRTDDDFNTVFYFNIAVSLLCYGILWVSAPYIARFYRLPILTSITRTVSLSIIINALCNNQWTKLLIDIDFKKQALISSISITTTGVIGLIMAHKGYGVWALVFQSLSSAIIRCILLFAMIRWIPKFVFSWKSFKELFAFGSNMLVSGIISTIYSNLITLLIGRTYDANSLGYFSRANSIAELPSTYVSSTIQSVSYPVLSSLQGQRERLFKYFRSIYRLTVFIVFPLMVGLSAVARPLIHVLLTEAWDGCVEYLQILCFALLFAPISAINRNLIMVLGRSDMYLRLEIGRRLLGLSMIIVAFPFGVKALCYGQIIAIGGDALMTSMFLYKLTGYGPLEQLQDVRHICSATIIMGIITWLFSLIPVTSFVKLALEIIIGGLCYLGIAWFYKFHELTELYSIYKAKINK